MTRAVREVQARLPAAGVEGGLPPVRRGVLVVSGDGRGLEVRLEEEAAAGEELESE